MKKFKTGFATEDWARQMNARLLVLLLFLLPCWTGFTQTIGYNEDSPPVRFGISRIGQALSKTSPPKILASGETGDILVRVDESISYLQREGYEITRKGKQLVVRANHSSGAMYGSLDVAEQIRMGKDWRTISSKMANPRFTVRAVKFNLPWSSYRTGPAMAQHMQVCRDLGFWQAFLDAMAENRFNMLSLWNVHPFSYMVRPHHFPGANNFSDREMAEWKDFWTALFRMCRERGIEPFIVNWNIAVSPEFAQTYGVWERNDTSAIVKRYTREVVTQVINEYPDLAGIGITLADWMSNFRQPASPLPEMTPAQREDWISETVVAGMKQARRPVKFLHRSVLSADPREMRRVIDDADFPDTTLVEIKFNWSHGHSATALYLTHDQHSGKVENHYWDPLPENYRIQWMIRNEDFFILRWGQPDFIRKHIAENAQPYVNGYFVGSEGYIPALEFAHRDDDHRSWQYAFQKQWLFYELWGRLLYDPSTPDEVFAASFNRRYGIKNGDALLEAFSAASNMPLKLASFHAATWDYTLYSEGFLAPFPSNDGLHDTISSFISIDELIHHRTLDPGLLSITEYVEGTLGNMKFVPGKITPLMLADSLEANSHQVISIVRAFPAPSPALACELGDLETWANLSLYFADKIRAGVALQRYRLSGHQIDKEKAVRLLEGCAGLWKRIGEITEGHYREVPYIDHSGNGNARKDAQTFSWSKYLPQAERDIDIARQAVPATEIRKERK